MKKQIIWTSETYLDDDAREEYQQYQREILEDEEYCITDREWAEVVDGYLADERMNLDKEVDGVIIAFANVGRWNGRRQGYKILGNTINEIFNISEDSNEWYSDGNNIRAILAHHDASHYVLYCRNATDLNTRTDLRMTKAATENEYSVAAFNLCSQLQPRRTLLNLVRITSISSDMVLSIILAYICVVVMSLCPSIFEMVSRGT